MEEWTYIYIHSGNQFRRLVGQRVTWQLTSEAKQTLTSKVTLYFKVLVQPMTWSLVDTFSVIRWIVWKLCHSVSFKLSCVTGGSVPGVVLAVLPVCCSVPFLICLSKREDRSQNSWCRCWVVLKYSGCLFSSAHGTLVWLLLPKGPSSIFKLQRSFVGVTTHSVMKQVLSCNHVDLFRQLVTGRISKKPQNS